MKCSVCENDLFMIIKLDTCDGCESNGAWSPEEEQYIYDEVMIKFGEGLCRDQVQQEDECKFGTSYDLGCHRYVCNKCGEETHSPTLVG